jgi:hypothetical protein
MVWVGRRGGPLGQVLAASVRLCVCGIEVTVVLVLGLRRRNAQR